ncbi:MAG: helix-turn-helix transcriptional regulator [Pseudomonadota bacterium]
MTKKSKNGPSGSIDISAGMLSTLSTSEQPNHPERGGRTPQEHYGTAQGLTSKNTEVVGYSEGEIQDESRECLRSQQNAKLRAQLGRRFVAARELCGLAQTEAAKKMGYINSTQLSLVEQGKRLPPVAAIERAAIVYGVAVDFLFDLTSEPERDTSLASRNGAIRRVQDMLERHAEAVAEHVLVACKGDLTVELRTTGVVKELSALLDGLENFFLLNKSQFDDLRGGATLIRRAINAREALDKVVLLLSRKERLVEMSLQHARAAVESAEGSTGSHLH